MCEFLIRIYLYLILIGPYLRNPQVKYEVDLGSCVQLYSLAEIPQLYPSPRIWAHIRGRYWSAKIYSNYEKPKPQLEISNSYNEYLFLCEHK
jgi:hypothetical protein